MSSALMGSGWYIWKQGMPPDQRWGPYSWEQMLSYAQAGPLDPEDKVWHDQWGAWIPASEVPGLWPGQPAPSAPQPPPVMYGPAPYGPGPVPDKAGWWGRRSLVQKLGMVGGVVVALIIIAVAVVLTAGRDSASITHAPDSTVTTLAETDSAAVLTGTDSAQTFPEQEISLRVGGSILASEDTFPEGTEIGSALTVMPLLPDDVTPVGRAFTISATAEPTTPVTLKLPIPDDAGDPSALTVVRIEADGTTTFLATTVEDDMLVAGTPGFSTFVVVEMLQSTRGWIVGKPDLLLGSREVYYFEVSETAANVSAPVWTLKGKASMIYEGEISVIIQAAATPGVAHLSCDCVDMGLGRRWYGYRYLRIVDDLDPGSSSAETFAVSALTQTPLVLEGQQVNITARASGTFKGPLTWTWDFGDGQQGGPATTEEGTVNFELPPKSYEFRSSPTSPNVVVKVKDAEGQRALGTLSMRVFEKDNTLKVAIDGPQIVQWSDPAAYEAYTARTSGGEASAHGYAFLLRPSGQSEFDYDVEKSTQTFVFDQPGDYRLMVALLNQDGDQYANAYATLPISVRGGEELSLRILDLPERAEVGEEVPARVQIRGGVLVVAAKKGGYTLLVDWGDDSPSFQEEDLGAALKPSDGIVIPLAHTYEESGTYLVRVFAFDATGTMDYVTQEVTVGGDAGSTTDAPGGDNTPPEAEDITTSTGAGTPVPVTLKGADADGDDLTYSVVRGPTRGKLTGSEPFLTYTPNANFTGTDSFTYRVNDDRADSKTATVTIEVRGPGLRWVRSGAPVVNYDKVPLEYYGGGSDPTFFSEARFEGMFLVYRASETSFGVDDRWVDHGFESWNVSFTCKFDPPPAELLPGEEYELEAEFTHSGTVSDGDPGGQAFQYFSDGGTITPNESLSYFPWSPDPAVHVPSKTWYLTVPKPTPGATLVVRAGLWGAPPCNVGWTYEAE